MYSSAKVPRPWITRNCPNRSSSGVMARRGSANGPVWEMGLSLVGKMFAPGQRVGELGEGERSPSASQQEDPGGGNGSRARTLPAATSPTKYRNRAVIITPDLFALGIRDRQGPFDGSWINVRSVNLFPEHGGKILDLEFRPIDEGYIRGA